MFLEATDSSRMNKAGTFTHEKLYKVAFRECLDCPRAFCISLCPSYLFCLRLGQRSKKHDSRLASSELTDVREGVVILSETRTVQTFGTLGHSQ